MNGSARRQESPDKGSVKMRGFQQCIDHAVLLWANTGVASFITAFQDFANEAEAVAVQPGGGQADEHVEDVGADRRRDGHVAVAAPGDGDGGDEWDATVDIGGMKYIPSNE